MKLNIQRLEEEDVRIENIAKEECYETLPEKVIQFLNNDVLNYVLHSLKYSMSDIIAPRVLNNWIKEGVVSVDDKDKGKIKRFDRLQCIWLKIVDEARKYGMPLDSLKKAHRDIMTSDLPNFSYLKLAIINTMLNEPQVMELSHTGSCRILSKKNYSKKKELPAHVTSRLVFFISDIIQKEFKDSNFDLPITIDGSAPIDDSLLLLFLLKTSCYEYMKVYLSDTDIRMVENSKSITESKEVHQAISLWKFHKIEVHLEGGAVTTINTNP